MAPENVWTLRPPQAATPRETVPGLCTVVALFDRPVDPGAARWLREYVVLPPDLERRVVRVANRGGEARGSPSGAAWAGLDDVSRFLGADAQDRRHTIGAFGAAASAFDTATALSIVVDDGTARAAATQWALRSARGSVLVLPAVDPPSPGDVPRKALLVARDESEIGTLLAWSRLLQAEVEIELRSVFRPASEAPATVLRELQALRRTLLLACCTLAAQGRVARADAVLSDDPIEDGCGLVVRIARRGSLRRWLPGADARACRRNARARLLIAPSAVTEARDRR